MTDIYETNFKIKVFRYLKSNYPGIWLWKISDKFTSGIPDVLCIYNGRHIFFELKTPKGSTTKLQDFTIDQINKAGGEAYVIKSLDQIDEVLSER